jgi:hypothetical protein
MRDEIGLGSSNSPIVVVVDVDTGEHVAKISYNGRVWGADGKEIPINERKTVARHDAEGWVDFKRRRVASCAC